VPRFRARSRPCHLGGSSLALRGPPSLWRGGLRSRRGVGERSAQSLVGQPNTGIMFRRVRVQLEDSRAVDRGLLESQDRRLVPGEQAAAREDRSRGAAIGRTQRTVVSLRLLPGPQAEAALMAAPQGEPPRTADRCPRGPAGDSRARRSRLRPGLVACMTASLSCAPMCRHHTHSANGPSRRAVFAFAFAKRLPRHKHRGQSVSRSQMADLPGGLETLTEIALAALP